MEHVISPEDRAKQPFFEEDLPFEEALGIADKIMLKQYQQRALEVNKFVIDH